LETLLIDLKRKFPNKIIFICLEKKLFKNYKNKKEGWGWVILMRKKRLFTAFA